MLVAHGDDERPVGFAELDARDGVVNACYVDPTEHGRGVGRALMDAIERAARAEGLRQLTLDASLNAVPFYRALGWRETGPARHELAPGAWLECIAMKRSLA